MADNIVRREVQRRDDPFGIPACFYWTIDEVADWIESIGYAKYKENFRSHFINGRKLLTVDACVLPKMGITHFGDILSICLQARELSSIRRVPFSPYVDTTHVYLFHHDIRPDPTGPPKDLAGRVRNLLCTGRRLKYKPPELEAPFLDECFYEHGPIDGVHPEYNYFMWYPRPAIPKPMWLTHPEFVSNASTQYAAWPAGRRPTSIFCLVRYSIFTETRFQNILYKKKSVILELAGYIRDLIGKGSKATWLPPLPGPKFHGGPQRFQLEACHGNDIDYNWRYSVPEFHFGYMPKRHPVTVADFHVRWLNNSQQACKLLGRHLFDLHRPA